MTLWQVRAGKKDEARFLEASQIDVGFDVAIDAGALASSDMLKVMIQEDFPNDHSQTNAHRASQVWMFAHEMQQGDHVAVPLIDSSLCHVGEITGAYRFDASAQDHRHIRAVRWVAQGIPRTQFDDDIPDAFIRQTIRRIDLPDAERRAREAAEAWAASAEGIADELLLDPAFFHDIESCLEDESKRQAIFQGPPGTGKTYVARRLAERLAGSPERVRLVQFHPSYAYEDFVQGFRPTLKDGQAGFALRDGPLVEMAERAREAPNEKHFLIIDEINRGNLAKVFGELYFLLEYRDHAMHLQYAGEGDEPFSLPKNLYLIGTMNTADRSIALVDQALRRRFHFFEFHPDKPPINGLLKRWLEREGLGMEWLPGVLERANGKLDRQGAIGPSYFMGTKRGLDEETARRIWKHSVLPYVEEQLYGERDRLAEFDLDRLRREATGEPEPDGDAPTAN